MPTKPSRRLRRKSIFQYIVDWVNTCDLTQLDAIMAALFVFAVGCSILGGMFVLGKIQSLSAASPPQFARQTIVLPARQAGVFTTLAPSPLNAMPASQAYALHPNTVNNPTASSLALVGSADASYVVYERAIVNRFGRPRLDYGHSNGWYPFARQQSGQAEAATGISY